MRTSFIRLFNPKIPSLNGGFSVSKSGSLFCFKNFPNLHYKNRALVTGGSTCNGLMSGFWVRYLHINKSRTNTVASAPAGTGSAFMRILIYYFWYILSMIHYFVSKKPLCIFQVLKVKQSLCFLSGQQFINLNAVFKFQTFIVVKLEEIQFFLIQF